MKIMKYYNINVRRRVENIHIILYSVLVPCEGKLSGSSHSTILQTARDTHMNASLLRVREKVPRYARAASDAAAGHDLFCIQPMP